jgi:adenine-specific DNA-methyltransferase
MENIDEQTDALLFHSENFQALNLMSVRYRERVKCIYIDPPYNVPGSEISYKNEFLHSSWLSLIDGRLTLGTSALLEDGFECITIDDNEKHRLLSFIEAIGRVEDILGVVCIRNNPSGRATVKGFAINHEYAVFLSNGRDRSGLGRFRHSENQRQRYGLKDDAGRSFEWENMRKSSAGSLRRDRPKQHFALFVDQNPCR